MNFLTIKCLYKANITQLEYEQNHGKPKFKNIVFFSCSPQQISQYNQKKFMVSWKSSFWHQHISNARCFSTIYALPSPIHNKFSAKFMVTRNQTFQINLTTKNTSEKQLKQKKIENERRTVQWWTKAEFFVMCLWTSDTSINHTE